MADISRLEVFQGHVVPHDVTGEELYTRCFMPWMDHYHGDPEVPAPLIDGIPADEIFKFCAQPMHAILNPIPSLCILWESLIRGCAAGKHSYPKKALDHLYEHQPSMAVVFKCREIREMLEMAQRLEGRISINFRKLDLQSTKLLHELQSLMPQVADAIMVELLDIWEWSKEEVDAIRGFFNCIFGDDCKNKDDMWQCVALGLDAIKIDIHWCVRVFQCEVWTTPQERNTYFDKYKEETPTPELVQEQLTMMQNIRDIMDELPYMIIVFEASISHFDVCRLMRMLPSSPTQEELLPYLNRMFVQGGPTHAQALHIPKQPRSVPLQEKKE